MRGGVWRRYNEKVSDHLAGVGCCALVVCFAEAHTHTVDVKRLSGINQCHIKLFPFPARHTGNTGKNPMIPLPDRAQTM